MKRLLCILCLLAATAVYVQATDKPNLGLSSQQLEQVQYVGQALLGAKRSATADPDLEAIRSNLAELHAELQDLEQLELNSIELKSRISVSGAVQTQEESFSVSSAKKERSGKIQKAKELTGKLVDRVLTMKSKHDSMRGSSTSDHQSIYSQSLSDPLLNHVVRIQKNLDEFNSLSGAERQQALDELKKATKVVSMAEQVRQSDNAVQDQPTMTSRTQHRRSKR